MPALRQSDPARRAADGRGHLPQLRHLVPGRAGRDRTRAAELLPRAVGKFQVLAVLGRGTFGTVYKATDPDLARTVAVKVPRAGYFASSEDEERFLREARSAAQLSHPGIVKVLEIARERGVPYIVSELHRRPDPGRPADRLPPRLPRVGRPRRPDRRRPGLCPPGGDHPP